MGNLPVYATKGFEYLLILGFLIVFTTFFLYFTSRGFEEAKAVVRPTIDYLVDWFRVPDNVLFHQGHAWARVEESEPGIVRVGMDDFALKMAGSLAINNSPPVGSAIKQGGKGWSLHDDKKAVDMLMPLSGEVVDVNEEMLAAVESDSDIDSELRSDPYGKGWILKIKPEDFERESRGLLKGSLARKWMEGVTNQLRQKMSTELGDIMQDGGVPMAGMAKNINAEEWDLLLKEFFMT